MVPGLPCSVQITVSTGIRYGAFPRWFVPTIRCVTTPSTGSMTTRWRNPHLPSIQRTSLPMMILLAWRDFTILAAFFAGRLLAGSGEEARGPGGSRHALASHCRTNPVQPHQSLSGATRYLLTLGVVSAGAVDACPISAVGTLDEPGDMPARMA